MTPRAEDLILSGCCALDLQAGQRERIGAACAQREVDWSLVFRASVAHKITPLVYRNLKLCEPAIGPLPPGVADKFIQASRTSSFRNLLVANGIADVAAYFDRHAHDILILKHAAYYLKYKALFDVTMSVDTDLVARPRGEAGGEKAKPYLWSSNNIPDPTWNVIDGLIHSNDARTRSLNLEIDNRLHHDVVWNGVIPIDFRRIWTDADAHQIAGTTLYIPHIHDLIIISAVNIFRKPFVRLRNVIEIHELIAGEKKFDWDGFSKKARAYQCGSLVYSALSATQSLLGVSFEEAHLTNLIPASPRAAAIAYVSRRISPTAAFGEDSKVPRERRTAIDFVRRLLAFDLRQAARFVWFRILLRRVAGVIKH